MENKNKNEITDLPNGHAGFHAVDFMRQVRSELTEQFLQDKQKYFDYLKRAMEDFKLRQQKHKG